MHHFSRRLGIVIAGITAGTCIIASTRALAESPNEDHIYQPIPDVWSATRLSSPVTEIPASVTVIDRETIEASPALTIPDLLRLVPGFQVALATGAQYTATYHGAADQLSRRLEVMVNGRSVYNAENASVNWNTLGVALEDIERIEVIRSPNAPAMGSNAIFGSVNIITRRPFEIAGKYLRGTIGSLNTGIGVARLGGKMGEVDAVATVQYSESDGFKDVDDHLRMRSLRFEASHQMNLSDTLDFELGISDGEMGAFGSESPNDPERDRQLRDNYQKIEWRRSQPDQERYRLMFWHRYTYNDDSFEYHIAPGTFIPLGFYNNRTHSYYLEFEHALAPRPTWKFLWGAGARYDSTKSDLYLKRTDDKATEWSGRLFANAEWRPIKQVLLNIGGLAEMHERSDTYTSPRAGINWLINDNHTLRASASRSYRVFSYATQVADYPLITSNGDYLGHLLISEGPGLDPEKLTSYELGYIGSWPQHNLSLDLKLFRESFRHESLGVRNPSGTTVWGDRGGRWDTRGAEAQIHYSPFRGTSFIGAYSYAKLEGTRPRTIDAEGNLGDWKRLDDTAPRHTLSLQLSQKFDNDWLATLALYHISDMEWLGEGSDVDGYTRLDLKISKSFDLGNANAEISLIGQNLTGDDYYEFRESDDDRTGNLFERRVFLQVALRWP